MECLAETLAEKVARGEVREEHALCIGKQILRDNALELFPRLKGGSGNTKAVDT